MKLVAIAVFVLTVSVTAQVEHAPTVAQCQADQRLWLAELEEDAKGSGNGLPHYDGLRAWNKEMDQCQDVDPDNHHRYYNTQGEIHAQQIIRLQHFLGRHNMWLEFRKEDSEGKR